MSLPKWHKFDPAKWRRKLPPEREWVIVTFPPEHHRGGGFPRSFAVGYLRFAAGDRKSPFFVIPGIGGTPDAWASLRGLPALMALVAQMEWRREATR